jgi:hypothetical protein
MWNKEINPAFFFLLASIAFLLFCIIGSLTLREYCTRYLPEDEAPTFRAALCYQFVFRK